MCVISLAIVFCIDISRKKISILIMSTAISGLYVYLGVSWKDVSLLGN